MNEKQKLKRLRRNRDVDTPSARALRLAVKLSGHEGTRCKYGALICAGCIANARIIDRELRRFAAMRRNSGEII